MHNKTDCREAFSSTVITMAKKDERIVVVCNDSVSSSNMTEFESFFPTRLFNVGIAEQSMIGVAAGLANSGFIPVVCSASCFLTARAFEQIKVDIGYSNANVKLFGMSPGFAYGSLGATHHSPEDITLMHAIPRISIAAPSDPGETGSATEIVIKHIGPTFLRVIRAPVKSFVDAPKFRFGRSNLLQHGSDVLFVANGLMLQEAEKAINILKAKGLSCGLMNASSVRPFDAKTLLMEAGDYKLIVTVEEGSSIGGLGGVVSQIISEKLQKSILQIGVDDFAPTGTSNQILKHFGLDSTSIAHKVQKVISAV